MRQELLKRNKENKIKDFAVMTIMVFISSSLFASSMLLLFYFK